MSAFVYGVVSSFKKEGFAPRQPTWDYPVSRDWIELDCNAVSCINNRDKKCSIPSLANINKDGKCEGFKVKG